MTGTTPPETPTTELLQHARKFEVKANADDILGDPIPVRRKELKDASVVMRAAYTALLTPPDPAEEAAKEIDALRTAVRWLYATASSGDLSEEELQSLMPPNVLKAAAFVWRPTEQETP